MLCVWEEYFKKLLNPEGECEIEIPHSVRRKLEVRTIIEEKVEKTVKKMKTGKAVGVDELSVDFVKANELVGIKWLTRLFNVCFTTGEIPAEWRRRVIVPILKGKGDIHDPERYKGITLLSQALKFMERILDARVRHIVESKIREIQLGFSKGRGTDDCLPSDKLSIRGENLERM